MQRLLAMLRRLSRSTVASLVAAIFLLQIVSGGAAILLLHSQMLEVVAANRINQILDVHDDLMTSFYAGGRASMEEFIRDRRGSIGDPLVFVAVTPPDRPEPELLSNIAEVPPVAKTGKPEPVHLRQASDGEPPVDGVALASDLPDGTRLVVGAATSVDRRVNRAFAEAITLTVVLTAVLALLGALALGYAISRRTHHIAQTAEALASGDFGARIAQENSGDGFDHLRRQMNFMAERIDRLVRELRSVSGTLAHDLRSPVARLRASIDVALAATDAGSSGEALQLARSDAEALEAMLATALELSRLESGTVSDRRQNLDLGGVAMDLAELYEPLAEQSGVALSCDPAPVEVLADRELVSRALANLIDNALKYGGDRIVVSTRADGARAVLEVADNGPGIAEGDRARAVDRFTRLDNARTRPGAGLGLAMVAAVAQLHGGSLELDSGAVAGGSAGLIVRIRLPRA